MRLKDIRLSVVIPVYNEESTVGEVIQKVRAIKIPKEIIVIDDGSTDKTAEAIESEKKKKGDPIRTYFSPVNFGKGAGIRIGYKFARGDLVIIQDADLELDPRDYFRLIEPILEGRTDVVYGSRFLRKNPKIRLVTKAGNKFINLLFRFLYGGNITDLATGYKVMRREIAQSLNLKEVGFQIDPEITVRLRKKGIDIYEVPVEYNPREAEGKKVNYIRDGIKDILLLLKYRFID